MPSLMELATGEYFGTNLLWFMDPDAPEESPTEVQVEAGQIRYTWQYKEAPQSGVLEFSFEGDQVSVDWTDTWHAAETMHCKGTRTGDAITVLVSYGAGEGPDWSWRTELRFPGPDQFLMEMYNIEPDGKEQIAVRLRADRKS